MKARTWTCPRRMSGLRCGGINSSRARKCHTCGKRRPPQRRPKHMQALARPYEEYVALNGGDHCFLCFATPDERKMNRDHDHATGEPRGLLCWRCNKFLQPWMTPRWLRLAAYYLERASS